jgi:phosphopantothenoylcysteine decarboxylase/phosphopantothenate--cysteine ligase
MGVAMAEAAQNLGADVTLIHGPVSISKPEGIHTVSITSAADLFEAIKKYADADIIIMAAAVSDFTPTEVHSNKVKKTNTDGEIKLKQTQDILAWLGDHKKENQILIGFAMETENLIENATSKLKKKNADFIIANSLNDKDSGFESDSNTVHLLGKDSDQKFQGSKKDISIEILNTIFR